MKTKIENHVKDKLCEIEAVSNVANSAEFQLNPIRGYIYLSMWMRSSLVIRSSDCQCRSCKSPGFDPSILRHRGIWGAADEAMLNTVHRRKKFKKITLFLWSGCFAQRFAGCNRRKILPSVGNVAFLNMNGEQNKLFKVKNYNNCRSAHKCV